MNYAYLFNQKDGMTGNQRLIRLIESCDDKKPNYTHLALKYIKGKKFVTYKTLAKELLISENHASLILSRFKAKGLVYCDQSERKTKYYAV